MFSARMKFRSRLALWAWDVPRIAFLLLAGRLPAFRGAPLLVGNRSDRLRRAPRPETGVSCDWRWSRPVFALTEAPLLARALSRQMASRNAVCFREEPEAAENPEVSFAIGHRGTARLPHLLATLASIAGQRGVPVEAVVVEQSPAPELAGRLPGWVRFRHQSCAAGAPYNRSSALNAAAALCGGRVIILHDSDLLVPGNYAIEHARMVRAGWEAVDLKRFIFYLDRSWEMVGRAELPARGAVLEVVQNLCGGGSIGITPGAFHEIGGMDESFVGWGGEDEEFWDRLRTRKLWAYGRLPLWHLWHDWQPMKRDPLNPTRRLLEEKLKIPRSERIRALRCR